MGSTHAGRGDFDVQLNKIAHDILNETSLDKRDGAIAALREFGLLASEAIPGPPSKRTSKAVRDIARALGESAEARKELPVVLAALFITTINSSPPKVRKGVVDAIRVGVESHSGGRGSAGTELMLHRIRSMIDD